MPSRENELHVGSKTPGGLVRGDGCVNCRHSFPVKGVWCCMLEEQLPDGMSLDQEHVWIYEHQVNEACWCPSFDRQFVFKLACRKA